MSLSTITFFPVDNGNISLIKLNDDNETIILTDIFIRQSADDKDDDDSYDVSSYLRNQIKDKEGIPYIDVFLLTHNDDDHINGLSKHFYLGDPSDYPELSDDDIPLIVINELWSSTRFWNRSSDSNKLCDDAKEFNKEMKRRVKLFDKTKVIQSEGNRAKIIGLDPDGKTDKIKDIVFEIDETVTKINEIDLSSKIYLNILGPLPQQEDEPEDDFKKSNRGSVIINFSVIEGNYTNRLLLGGDSEVFVWECLGEKYKDKLHLLDYDVLLSPHHCSWHSLSYDSQSDDDNPQTSEIAVSALSQSVEGAFIVSSSKQIIDDDNDPPSNEAKIVYISFIDKSHFICTQEYPNIESPEPLVINLTDNGPQLKSIKSKSKISMASTAATGEAFPHGYE